MNGWMERWIERQSSDVLSLRKVFEGQQEWHDADAGVGVGKRMSGGSYDAAIFDEIPIDYLIIK